MKQEDLILQAIQDLRESMENRFQQVNYRLDQIEKRLDRIEDNQIREKDRLDKVYESRDKVKVTFGWQWGMVSMFIAVMASGITKIFS